MAGAHGAVYLIDDPAKAGWENAELYSGPGWYVVYYEGRLDNAGEVPYSLISERFETEEEAGKHC